jgi:hypothetical protein
MYLKRIAMSRIKDGDFIVIQALQPDDLNLFRFQYSGTVRRVPAGFYLDGFTIEKFDPKGKHLRTTHAYEEGGPSLLCVFETVESCFKVVL